MNKLVDLGIGNGDSTICTCTVTLPGTPFRTDSLIRTLNVQISESTSVSVVRIAGPQCTSAFIMYSLNLSNIILLNLN